MSAGGVLETDHGAAAVITQEAINIFSSCNIAIPLAYFCVGFAGSFIDTPLKVCAVRSSHPSQVEADSWKMLAAKVLSWSS